MSTLFYPTSSCSDAVFDLALGTAPDPMLGSIIIGIALCFRYIPALDGLVIGPLSLWTANYPVSTLSNFEGFCLPTVWLSEYAVFAVD